MGYQLLGPSGAQPRVVVLQSFESVRLVSDRPSTPFLVAEAIHDHELQDLHLQLHCFRAVRRP